MSEQRIFINGRELDLNQNSEFDGVILIGWNDFVAGWIAGCFKVQGEGQKSECWLDGYKMAEETRNPIDALIPEIETGHIKVILKRKV